MRADLALVASLALAGCAAPPEGDEDLRLLDRHTFSTIVQPILSKRCSNPSCHGRPERGLSIFAPGRFRADPSRVHLDEPLFEDELFHNYLSTCVFSGGSGEASDAPFAAKPLAARVYHGGGAVFAEATDRDYRTFVAWIEAGPAPAQGEDP